MERKLVATAYVKLRKNGPEHFINFYQNNFRFFRSTYELTPDQQDEFAKDGRETFPTFDACKHNFDHIVSKNNNILVDFIIH